MNNKQLYSKLIEGELELPSVVGVIPYSDDYGFDFKTLEDNLRNSDYFEVDRLRIMGKDIICKIKVKDNYYKMRISIEDTVDLDLNAMNFANKVSANELDKVKDKEHYIQCITYFDDDALTSYHVQLKVMDTLVPDRGLLLDFCSFMIFSGDWLKMTAVSNVPPKPSYLYTVHAIYDEEDDKKNYWLHTHGLHRCGCVELELLDIKDNVDAYYSMLNTFAQRLLEEGMINSGEIYNVCNNIEVTWLPWEKGLKKIQKGFIFKEKILGGPQDRDDEVHSGPSGILFIKNNKKIINPNIYSEQMGDNPVFFITTKETERMARLAKERIKDFKYIFNKFNENENWTFLVKLGYLVDDYENDEQREHLWFEVKAIDGDTVDAILINKPYWIARFKENDRDFHELDKLTDWIIYSPKGSFTPDSLYRFYQLYEN